MEIIDLKDEEKWRDFLTANPGESGAEFLASSKWAAVLKSEGTEVKCLAAVDASAEILGLVLLVKKFLGGGFYYWYAPRGPILKKGLSLENEAEGKAKNEAKDEAESKVKNEAKEVISLLIAEIQKSDNSAVFLKIEPAQFLSKFWESNLQRKFKNGLDVQPKKTLILDLKKTEEELLRAMHQKTRYNINLAAKKGVKIIEGGEKDFSEFWRLMELTGMRDGFRIHDETHYKKLINREENKDKKFIKLFFAEFQGRKIATALVCCFGNKVTYLHGASDNEFRNTMAPYLLQWEIIKLARTEGANIYDFYGIDEKKWPGVTRFKLGFGGEERVYPGVFEIVFRPVIYTIYNTTKKIKRIFK
ncbi:MAG: peptidoglycan bridge formation glycyltransferase FemA/FemB family protein [Patescibacteria group bacterium]